MKIIFYGGQSHDKMLHSVADNVRSVERGGEIYKLHRRLTGNIFVFTCGKLDGAKFSDQCREWERLLSF